MKISSICLGFALLAAPAMAQTPIKNLAPLPVAPKLASVTPFITGLKEPQGMALDTQKNVLVCDYGTGEIWKYSSDGKRFSIFAAGLNGPSAIVSSGDGTTLVSETKANRVLRFRDGKMSVEMDDVEKPIGLLTIGILSQNPYTPSPLLIGIVSSTTSKIYSGRLRNNSQLIYADPNDKNEERYGFSWLAGDYSTILASDGIGKRILMIANGRIATFAGGISKPAGLAIGPDKSVYVANEGDGGQLIRLNSEGEKTIIAENLGRPCAILFLDAKTLLVSNRDGNIWKVALP